MVKENGADESRTARLRAVVNMEEARSGRMLLRWKIGRLEGRCRMNHWKTEICVGGGDDVTLRFSDVK
ncbi:unnamed protein product [Anisakis simplex]|uniref:Uncharacterized protein n=1 Tax=Anisakis simplex TaxID=6269 RepID=A0A0M3J7J5_ANISI|nr:unnamed protein product [Anisakis simplex]